MRLKNIIDKQIYQRERVNLGRTNIANVGGLTFNDDYSSSKLYKLPVQWVQKSYFFNRPQALLQFTMQDMLSFSGSVQTLALNTTQTGGVTAYAKISGMNIIHLARTFSQSGFSTKLKLTTNKSVYAVVALYYDGQWSNNFSEYTNNIETTLTIPAHKDVTIAIGFYAIATTKYDLGIDFSQEADITFSNGFVVDTPATPTLTLQQDRDTRNISVVINYEAPTNQLAWNGTRIWRKNYRDEAHNIYQTNEPYFGNGVLLNTGNKASMYTPGKEFALDNMSYFVNLSYDLAGNLIQNGNILTSTAKWIFRHTSTGAMDGTRRNAIQTAKPVKEYPLDGDKCVRFDIGASVSTVKSSYMETLNANAMSSNNQYVFMSHFRAKTATSFYPMVKFLFYKDIALTPSTLLSSATARAISLSSVWGQFKIPLLYYSPQNPYNYSGAITIPLDCTYMKTRIYASWGTFKAHKTYIDCIGLYATSAISTYNASSQPLTFVGIDEPLTLGLNNSTFDLFHGVSTSYGIARSVSKRLYKTSFAKYAPQSLTPGFTGGFESREVCTNYIKGGDFQDPTKFLKSQAVQFIDTEDTMFSNRAVYFPVTPSSLSLSTTRTLTVGIDGNTSIGVSVWAKGNPTKQNSFILIQAVDVDGNRTMGQFFNLTPKWDRYYFTKYFGARSANKKLKVQISTHSAYNGNIYLSGLQCEIVPSNRTRITSFLMQDTAANNIGNSYWYLGYSSAQAILGAPYGNFSFVVFPQNSSFSTASACAFFGMTDGTNEYSSWYDYRSKQLIFKSGANIVSHTCLFGARQPMYINLGWDTAGATGTFYFTYNGKTKRVSKGTVPTGTGSHFRFGFVNQGLSYGGGTIRGNICYTDIRFDTCAFTSSRVGVQRNAVQYEPFSCSATTLKTTDYISFDVPRGQMSGTLQYIDQRDIKYANTYEYKIQFIDAGVVGEYSPSAAIDTITAPVPTAVTATAAAVGQSWIEFKWKATDTANTHHFLVYNNTDKNYTNALYGPYVVPFHPTMSTVVWTMYDIYDTNPKSIWVLPFGFWDNVSTANAVKITGVASELIWARNLALNDSFEYLNPRDNRKVPGWDTSGALVGSKSGSPTFGGQISTAYFYTGGLGLTNAAAYAGRSCKVGGNSIIDYSYPVQKIQYPNFDSAQPAKFRLSFWSHTASYGGYVYSTCDACRVINLDAFGRWVGGRTMAMSKIDTKTGWDGKTWYRFATSFFHTIAWTSGLNYPVAIAFHPINGPLATDIVAGYVDAFQFEVATTGFTAYTPGRRNIVDAVAGESGGSLVQGTLNITNFPNNTLTIAGATGDAGRIVIGQEKRSNVFQEFTYNRARLHPANTTTSFGFNFAKHIESGSGVFGQTYAFTNRFTGWGGNAVTPLVLIMPKDVMIYTTAASTTQKISYDYTATPGGFVANAALYTNVGQPVDITFDKVATGYIGNPAGTGATRNKTYSESQNYTTDYSQWLATTFGKKSQGNSGYIKYRVSGQSLVGKPNYGLDDTQMRVHFWCSAGGASGSITITPVSTSTWRYLGYQWVNVQYDANFYTFNIATAAWGRATALCMYATSVTVNVRGRMTPSILNILTSPVTIYKRDAQIGTYYWYATDGGQI